MAKFNQFSAATFGGCAAFLLYKEKLPSADENFAG
jgi:hypothetical protein